MFATLVSLTLTAGTAWATIFLGFLPTGVLRLGTFSREVLIAAFAWIVVGLTAPAAICHWYFIFAIICFAAWRKLRNERALSAKTWLSVASGLGISIGIVFLIQAASAVCPPDFPPRQRLLLVASIYLGGAVTGLAYILCAVSRDPATSQSFASGYAKILVLLVILWDAVLVIETNALTASSIRPTGRVIDPHFLLVPMLLLPVLSLLLFHAFRTGAQKRAGWICAGTSVIAFGTSIISRWLLV